ncbi:NAD(P)H-dependent oxidoreductase [Labrys sp. KNU-23]|uniref:NADPH-dependent FMN reductase n=1 Tax=Labrys sp. KNU-23 TaxID=2789216 RepID=UPI0011EC2293|nr:NAD(P)H-dependent oxidoreductase [Labrys sp. KNU-23]QEN88646.1 NAD(P)H-dependent oxidoreductase [Labrys sp. KNU-23]
MSGPSLRLGLIYGSSRRGRFCDTIGQWVRLRLAQSGMFDIDVVDPQQIDLAALLHQEDCLTRQTLRRRLADADCFILVTPEYNHGYTAAAKLIIDAASREWAEKPIAFVSYGGISGGLRAVEQLRLVFAELHAIALRDSVSLANAWRATDADGRLVPGPETNQAMDVVIGQLQRWARTLRQVRQVDAAMASMQTQ